MTLSSTLKFSSKEQQLWSKMEKKKKDKDDQLDTFSQVSHCPENCIYQGKFQVFLNSSSLFLNCN